MVHALPGAASAPQGAPAGNGSAEGPAASDDEEVLDAEFTRE
jgi:hypothetical protein